MNNTAHADGSGHFDPATVAAYSLNRHGADGPFLLDRHILAFIDRVARPGRTGVDPGCGSGWLSILAARRGAAMAASDNNPAFVDKAKADVTAAELNNLIAVDCLDAQSLVYESEQFDFGISSNVGCAINAALLRAHLMELARVLRPGGELLLTCPASLDHVFTTDVDPTAVITSLNRTLLSATRPEDIPGLVKGEDRVHRATISWTGARAEVVSQYVLSSGVPIYRIISGPMVVPNFWHSEDDYRDAIEAAGLVIQAVHADRLTPETRIGINNSALAAKTLGSTYEHHPAFRVFLLQKPQQ